MVVDESQGTSDVRLRCFAVANLCGPGRLDEAGRRLGEVSIALV